MNRNLSNNLNKERLFMNEIVGIAATTAVATIPPATIYATASVPGSCTAASMMIKDSIPTAIVIANNCNYKH